MKNLMFLLASGLLAANFSGPAQAECYGEPAMVMGKMKGDCMMMGGHRMTGVVDKIDHVKGVLTLKSGAPDMTLHFPPASIKDLKNGDTITVDLRFTKGKPAITE